MSSDYQISSESSSEEEWNSQKKSRARRAKPTPPTRRNPKRYTRAEMESEIRAMAEPDSDDSETYSDEEVTSGRGTRSRRIIKESESEDCKSEDQDSEEELQRSYGTPNRPTRRCAVDTQRKLSIAMKSDRISEKEALADTLEGSEVEMLDDYSSGTDEKFATKRRKTKNDSSDEEYKEGLYENDEDSSENDSEEYDNDEEVARTLRRPQRSCTSNFKSYRINEDDIGTADEESADEDMGPSILVSPSKNTTMPYGSPRMRKKARARLRSLAESSSDEDSHNQNYFQHKCVQKASPSKLKTTNIYCSSTHDEITMMPLPKGKPHICYVTPDNRNRHCFTLETMYRIAISKTSDASTILSSNKTLQFLQPPHFRTPISDDLLDQIGSRFGRGALKIEDSVLYKKMKARSSGNYRGDISLEDDMDNFDSDGEYVGPHRQGMSGQNFDERFQRYLTNSMGSQDVYCCPLCYNEAYRRLGNMGDEELIEDDATDDEGGNENKENRFSFLDDPMTILGALDDHEFVMASTFCFRLLTGVKNHLKSVHHVDVTVVEGNDLYKRFQIRTGDGLLQSWLRKQKNTTQPVHLQGDMMRYWNEGENQSFLLLLNQIDRGQLEGHQSGDFGSNFSESFPKRARRIWIEVSSPFLKVQDDMDDFLAGESEEESDAEEVPINPHFTPLTKDRNQLKSPEDEMLEYLKRKNSRKNAAPASEDGISSSEGESSDELEVLSKQGTDEEDEEDEWVKSKQYSSQKKAKRFSKQNDHSDSDDLFDGNDVPETPMNSKIKSLGKDDSDEEEPSAPRSSSARKRVVDSSDEGY